MMRKMRIAVFAAGMAVGAAYGGSFPEEAFSYSVRISFPGYAGGTVLEDFPVLIRLSEGLPRKFSYRQCSADGADIRFTDANGNLLAHEVDTWNASGESLIWVRVPSLSAAAEITMHWGFGYLSGFPAVNPTETWSKYLAVWHLNSDLADSSGNGWTLTAVNSPVATSDAKLGGAYRMCGEDKTLLRTASNPLTGETLLTADVASVTGWVKPSQTGADARLFNNKESTGNDRGFDVFAMADGSFYMRGRGTANRLQSDVRSDYSVGSWHHVGAVMNGSSGGIVFNGAVIKSGTIQAMDVSPYERHFGIGNWGTTPADDGFTGLIDEVRIYNGAASGDWLKAENDTVSSSFAAFGSVRTNRAQPFGRCAALSVSGDAGAGATLTDFPVLVRLSTELIDGFLYSDCMAGGADVRFTDGNGGMLPHEIDCWNPDGESLIWVRIPSVSRGTEFRMHWKFLGSKTELPANDPKVVWAGYLGVWHLNSDLADSTGNGWTLTAVNSPVATVDTLLGGAFRMRGADATLLRTTGNPVLPAHLVTENVVSVSGWVRPDVTGGVTARLYNNKSGSNDQGFDLDLIASGGSDTLYLRARGANKLQTSGLSGFDAGEWHFLGAVVNGTSGSVYYEGASIGSTSALTAMAGQEERNFGIGNWGTGTLAADGFTGLMDEVRLYNGAATAGRMAAEYATVHDTDFIVGGHAQVLGNPPCGLVLIFR